MHGELRRTAFTWRKANPLTSLKGLADLHGIGPLVAVLALSGLAQFTLHATWVLYTAFKFGWGPLENGWSLFAVGVMSVLVQGVLLKHLLARFSPQRLAVIGLFSSSLCFLAWGLAPEGWMMFVVIGFNLFGFAAAAALQSIVSNAADQSIQGRTMGAVSGLNSMMAVIAPVIGAALLGFVSHLPKGDWRIGAPYYFCAALQALAMLLALRHFSRLRHLKSPIPASP